MDTETAIKELKDYIYESYREINEKIGPNIYRGHLRSLSTEIEDGIALFVSNLLHECKVFVDSSIHVGGKNNRPDIIVVNKDDEVISMIEIKSNMGWCRNAMQVIDDIVSNDNKFRAERDLYCEFSRENSQQVKYGDDVKLFLIALTDGNCTAKNHAANKAYAVSKNVYQYNLFSGWYGNLSDCEIVNFANELLR